MNFSTKLAFNFLKYRRNQIWTCRRFRLLYDAFRLCITAAELNSVYESVLWNDCHIHIFGEKISLMESAVNNTENLDIFYPRGKF